MNLKNIIDNKIFIGPLSEIDSEGSYIINTINANSYCMAKNDDIFADVLLNSDVLLPDGSSLVLASWVMRNKKINKIAGIDVHKHLIHKANLKAQKVFYLGANTNTLELIKNRLNKEFPYIDVESFSPPFKSFFTMEETNKMLFAINSFKPDILFVGMTAPKQEKWVYANKKEIDCNITVSIGAVFDFYAGTVKRAPSWMINLGMEWLYRLIKEPKRMWKRYLINNTKFLWYIFQEKFVSQI